MSSEDDPFHLRCFKLELVVYVVEAHGRESCSACAPCISILSLSRYGEEKLQFTETIFWYRRDFWREPPMEFEVMHRSQAVWWRRAKLENDHHTQESKDRGRRCYIGRGHIWYFVSHTQKVYQKIMFCYTNCESQTSYFWHVQKAHMNSVRAFCTLQYYKWSGSQLIQQNISFWYTFCISQKV